MNEPGAMVARVKLGAATRLGPPPADRPAGRRGWRGLVAAGLSLGAPAILFAVRLQGGGGGSGEVSKGASLEWALGGSPGTGLKAALVALVVLAAAALVWSARTRAGLLAATGLAVAGLAGAALVVLPVGGEEITRPQLRALEPGLSRAAVEDRLGTAGGTGHWSDARRDLDCLVWRLEGTTEEAFSEYALVCFAGDRVELRRRI